MSSTDDMPPSLWHRYSCFSATIKTGLICAALFNLAFGILGIMLVVCNKADGLSSILPQFSIYCSILLAVIAFKRKTLATFAYIFLNSILITFELTMIFLVALALIFSIGIKLPNLVDFLDHIYPGISHLGGTSTIATYFIFIQLAITSTRTLFEITAFRAFIQIRDQRREDETPLMTDAERRDQDLLLLTTAILNFSN